MSHMNIVSRKATLLKWRYSVGFIQVYGLENSLVTRYYNHIILLLVVQRFLFVDDRWKTGQNQQRKRKETLGAAATKIDERNLASHLS